jgi:hypothetical protein
MLVAVAALLFTAIGAGTASAATLATDDFEDGNASGWTTTGGTWIVTREDSRVLRQSNLAVNALARTGQPGWRNYTVSADVTPDSFNGMPGFAGVVARAQSTTVYYALVVRPDDSAALIRTIGTTSTTLAEADVEVEEGTTYRLSLRVSGRNLTGTVGGKTLKATDGFITSGPAGLTTKYGTASFDNVTVVN